MSGPLGCWDLCNHVFSGRGTARAVAVCRWTLIHLKYVHWEPWTVGIRKQQDKEGFVFPEEQLLRAQRVCYTSKISWMFSHGTISASFLENWHRVSVCVFVVACVCVCVRASTCLCLCAGVCVWVLVCV